VDLLVLKADNHHRFYRGSSMPPVIYQDYDLSSFYRSHKITREFFGIVWLTADDIFFLISYLFYINYRIPGLGGAAVIC